jgi:phasin
MAEKSVEQAKKAVDSFMTAAQQAVGVIEERTAAAQASVKDANRRAMTFAEQNLTTSFEFAQKLVRAKDPQEFFRLQSDFIRQQMQALSVQAKELGEHATRAAVDATTPKS